MEFLDQQYQYGGPFAVPSLTLVIADALLVLPTAGAALMDLWDPQAGSAASRLVVKQNGVVVLDATGPTSQLQAPWRILTYVDAARGTRARLVVSAARLPTALVQSGRTFAERCVVPKLDKVTSINGIAGAATLNFPQFTHAVIDGTEVTLNMLPPAERVTCPGNPCAQNVFLVNGQGPDGDGQLALRSDGCFRFVPDPTTPNRLYWFDLCVPCLACGDVQALSDVLNARANYGYQLGAIFNSQHSRYQVAVTEMNSRLCDQLEHATAKLPTGGVYITGRTIERPYFNQLVLAVANDSTEDVTVTLVGVIHAVNGLLTTVSAFIQENLGQGDVIDSWSGFPGTLVLSVPAQSIITVATEVKRATMDFPGPASGAWSLTGTIDTVTDSFPINLSYPFNIPIVPPTLVPAPPP